MFRTIKIITVSSYLEIMSFFRHKEAFFFGIIFPTFIFILFNFIWGGGGEYTSYVRFLLSGVIGMTIASDALFAIGPVIKIYKDFHILKFLRNLPINIILHFLGIFLSRILAMMFTVLVVCLSSIFIFNYVPTSHELVLFVSGVFIGTILFAFLGLVISFFTKIETGRGILNFIFFIMLFTSGTFYPVDQLPKLLHTFSHFFPLTHLLEFIRGNTIYIFPLLGWILLFLTLFYFAFNKSMIKR